jgi:hypothetical protein
MPPKTKSEIPTLKPFKFTVQATVLEVDGTGGIVAERPGEILTLYGVKQLAEWAQNFEDNLANAIVKAEGD